MDIKSSYSYFFNYINERYGKYKILRCFNLQMPVKEITFTSIDMKHIPIGDVEGFILKAIRRLKSVTVPELDYLFHLGEKYIRLIVDDFIELSILERIDGNIYCTAKAQELVNKNVINELIEGEHSIMFDVFMTRDEAAIIPAAKERYIRSKHNYYYPTEFNNDRPAFNPIILGTIAVTKEDITNLLKYPDSKKEELSISQNIIDVEEIVNVNNLSHSITFVLLLDENSNEEIRVFDACSPGTINEITNDKVIQFNLDYLKYTCGNYFGELSRKEILETFAGIKNNKYEISEKDIISLIPAAVRISTDEWIERAASGLWYDFKTGLVLYLYPDNDDLANSILRYKILIKMDMINTRNQLTADNLGSIIKEEVSHYKNYLKDNAKVKLKTPSIEEIFRYSIAYNFSKLNIDLQDILDL